ncbi:hypothetical protein BS78_04G158500 [Paspalum vaginatum]|nr:hypothetical protein BS78_04G158500 [Paspalum vaginatum]
MVAGAAAPLAASTDSIDVAVKGLSASPLRMSWPAHLLRVPPSPRRPPPPSRSPPPLLAADLSPDPPSPRVDPPPPRPTGDENGARRQQAKKAARAMAGDGTPSPAPATADSVSPSSGADQWVAKIVLCQIRLLLARSVSLFTGLYQIVYRVTVRIPYAKILGPPLPLLERSCAPDIIILQPDLLAPQWPVGVVLWSLHDSCFSQCRFPSGVTGSSVCLFWFGCGDG